VPLACNLGTLTSWNPLGHSRPVIRHEEISFTSLNKLKGKNSSSVYLVLEILRQIRVKTDEGKNDRIYGKFYVLIL